MKTKVLSIFLILTIMLVPAFKISTVKAAGIIRVQAPVTPTIVTSNMSNYAYMATATKANYLAYFKSNSYTSRSVRFIKNSYVIEFNIAQAQGQYYNSKTRAVSGNPLNPQSASAVVQNNKITYVGAWTNTNLTYINGIDTLDELLSIKSLPTNTSAIDYFRFRVDIYYNNSLTIQVNGNNYTHPSSVNINTTGQINFYANNNLVFWIPNATVYDSAGYNASVTYFLSMNNGVDLWYLGIPYSFLKTAIYPIYLDPIVRVQGNARGTSTTNSISVTMGATPTAGNLLVACIGTFIGTPSLTVTSITQTNVAWTYQISKHSVVYDYLDVEIWVGVVSASAGTGITIALSGAASWGGVADVCEYSGLATADFLDKTATATGQPVSLTSTGTTAVTSQNDELWIGAVTLQGGSQSTPQDGFTLLDGAQYTTMSLAYLEYISSATGAAHSGTTISGSYEYYVGCIATFKAAAAGQEVTFQLSQTIHATSSLVQQKELNKLLSETVKLTSSTSMLKEKGFSLTETAHYTSVLTQQKELGFSLSQIIALTSSYYLSKEKSISLPETSHLTS
jgi:hypothetical protein